MQVSRHWRLNSQRYRLQGIRYENGEVSLQARPVTSNNGDSIERESLRNTPDREREAVAAAGAR